MERKYYKAVNFDLDTNLLNEYHPRKKYNYAYSDLKKFFKAHGFSHRQGSGYVSNEKLTSSDIIDVMDDLCNEYSWIRLCVKKIDVTNIGAQYDLIELVRGYAADMDEDNILLRKHS